MRKARYKAASSEEPGSPLFDHDQSSFRVMSATVEINDCCFCAAHKLEVCEECGYDGREENDAFYGFDPVDREPVQVPSTKTNDDGVIVCAKHGNGACAGCFGWKKMIVRLRTAAKKAE